MASVCVEELLMMEKKSTRGSLLTEFIVATLGLPFAYITITIVSIYLYMLMYFYFKQLSIDQLNGCYDIKKQQCVRCLKKIYKNEQIALKNAKTLQNVVFLRWIYSWMIDRLEERAETLIFIVDEDISKNLAMIISDLETRKPTKSNWTQELDAL
jgi:hypothetical protein